MAPLGCRPSAIRGRVSSWIRGLEPGEEVAVAVFGGESGGKVFDRTVYPGGTSSVPFVDPTQPGRRRVVVLHRDLLSFSTQRSGPTYLLRLPVEDLLRAERGELSRAELIERVRVE